MPGKESKVDPARATPLPPPLGPTSTQSHGDRAGSIICPPSPTFLLSVCNGDAVDRASTHARLWAK